MYGTATTANDMPNYRYGVRGVRIANQLAPGSYDTPWFEVGAKSVEESAPSQSSTKEYSDDGKAVDIDGAKGNGTVNVQFAEFSKSYNTGPLGHKIDTTTGALVKSKDDEKGVFAAGWEVQGTKGKTRIWKLGCTSSEPTAGFQTKGDNVSTATQSCTWTVNGDIISGEMRDEIVCHEGDAGFDTFLDAVPETLAISGGAADTALSALAVGTLALNPPFSPAITEYTASTTGSSVNVTAIPRDSGASVTVKNGTTSVTNGGSASLSAGENTITAKVANSSDERTYTVVVTKS